MEFKTFGGKGLAQNKKIKESVWEKHRRQQADLNMLTIRKNSTDTKVKDQKASMMKKTAA